MRRIGGVLLGALAILLAFQWAPAQVPAGKKAAPKRPAAPVSEPGARGVQFTTLPGFKIERAIPKDKTDSYVVLTFDSLGRPVVSKESDSPRILLDNDGDGIFESEKVFADKVRNCQGIWFDGRTMYGACAAAPADAAAAAQGRGSGGAQSGVYKLTDTDGDDWADRFEEISPIRGGIQEHGPHAIRRGPDGSPAIIVGNNAFVPDDRIDPMSPLRGDTESQLPPALPDGRGFGPSVKEGLHSTLSRINLEKKNFSLLFGGLRNAYDFAHNLDGEAFTFDSDMEWDINLPWFREVKSVHMIPGGNGGYRNGSGKFPAYYIDSLPPLRELGRGSPVGVEFYTSRAYPAAYHDAYFEADWSRGRLLYTSLTRAGATYKARGDRAEIVHGEPLNITDLETGPDGMIYFTTGGRNTEGGLFRIRYLGPKPVQPAMTGILAAVRQPQPLSSWGFAAVEKVKASMGDRWAPELEKLARNRAASSADRARALYEMQRHGPAPPGELLKALAGDRIARVRAAAVFVAGLHVSAEAKAIAAGALKDSDPWVQRRAAEALVGQGLSADQPSFAPVADIHALLNSPDRFVRYAGRLALERTPRAEWRDRVLSETNVLGALEGMIPLLRTSPMASDLEAIAEKQTSLLRRTDLSTDNGLRLLRAIQLTALATPGGMRKELREQVHRLVAPRFPALDERLNREMARVLGYRGQPESIGKILAAMPQGDDRQLLQLHYAYVLRSIEAGWTKDQHDQFLDWFAKASKWRGGASFPGFVNAMFDQAIAPLNAEEKKAAYARVPQFAPLTEEELEKMRQVQAARGGGQAGRGRQGGGRGRGNTPVANARVRGTEALSPQELFEFLVFVPQRQAPNPANGRRIYEQDCASCHQFGSLGNNFGPDLTTLSSRFKKRDIVESLIWPSKTISDQYESSIIRTKDNDIINGLVVKEDARKLLVKTAEIERPIEIPRGNVVSRRISSTSIMPEGLLDPYSQQEIASLIAFLLGKPPSDSTANQ